MGRPERARAAFLDRDGVLNRALVVDGRPYAPRALEDFQLLPGVDVATGRLRDAGYLVIVVTNQPDVGRGEVSVEVLEAMHERLRAGATIDDIRVCTCDHDCPCYKPQPGLLLESAADWGIDVASSFMIGDRWRDVGAGRAAGCTTIFIDHGYRESLRDTPDHTVTDLTAAVDWITERPRQTRAS